MSSYIINRVRVEKEGEEYAVYVYGGDNNVFLASNPQKRAKEWSLLVKGDEINVLNSFNQLIEDFRGGMIRGRWKSAGSLQKHVKNQIQDIKALEKVRGSLTPMLKCESQETL